MLLQLVLRPNMPKHHSISSYDKNLCLKPDITMWLIFLFLSRAYVVLIMSVANMRDRTGLIDLFYGDRIAMSLGAVAGAPAALLVYAWLRRKPGAPPFVRNIWTRGRLLLVVSALLNAGVAFMPLWMGTRHSLLTEDWIQLAVALMIVPVIYTSSYIRDCFKDFPDDEVPEEK